MTAAIAFTVTRLTVDIPGPLPELQERYERAVMLYAPLHVMLWTDNKARAHLSVDWPSDQFASFGDPQIAAVGTELDRKLAVLLNHLGLTIPEQLTAT